jgi:hypothetical protein
MSILGFFRKELKAAEGVAASVAPLFPQILAAIIRTEQFAHSLPGATKEQIVVNTILAGAHFAQGVPVPAVQDIATQIAMIVGVLNETGIFNHGSKAPAPAVPAPVAVAA